MPVWALNVNITDPLVVTAGSALSKSPHGKPRELRATSGSHFLARQKCEQFSHVCNFKFIVFLLNNCQIYGCARIVRHTERAPWTILAHRDCRAGAQRRRADWASERKQRAQSAHRRSAPVRRSRCAGIVHGALFACWTILAQP